MVHYHLLLPIHRCHNRSDIKFSSLLHIHAVFRDIYILFHPLTQVLLHHHTNPPSLSYFHREPQYRNNDHSRTPHKFHLSKPAPMYTPFPRDFWSKKISDSICHLPKRKPHSHYLFRLQFPNFRPS